MTNRLDLFKNPPKAMMPATFRSMSTWSMHNLSKKTMRPFHRNKHEPKKWRKVCP